MIKYFYNNSLDAFYMERKWGVRYKSGLEGIEAYASSVDCVVTLGDHLRQPDKLNTVEAFVIQPDEPDTKWIVHEDSVHLFEPKVGDEVSIGNAIYGVISDEDYAQAVENNGGDEKKVKNRWIRLSDIGEFDFDFIVLRNNTAFIMPEVEHD